MAVVLISGGTGLIGTRLSTLLAEKGHTVIILTRRIKADLQHLQALWNPEKGTIDQEVLRKADYIINLAGEGIADKRWTAQRKQAIVDSRIKSTELIVKALQQYPHQIKAVVNASAIGWYGADARNDNTGFTEENIPAENFLGQTCREWENSIDPVAGMGIRLVKVRVGVVLASTGGALKEFSKPLRLGIAAILGNGQQVQSWIHIDDICRIFIYAIENNRISGVYNAVAPRPVDYKTLTLTLARLIKGSFYTSVYIPGWLLKLMLGQLAGDVLLASTTVSSEKIRSTGFQFIFPSIDAALQDLVKQA